jgi:hypothetical protein
MKYTYVCPECGHENEGDFTPGRPAPVCSNPSSPAFSDPGDGAEWDGPENCDKCGEEIDMDKVIEKAEASIIDARQAHADHMADVQRDREIDKE